MSRARQPSIGTARRFSRDIDIFHDCEESVAAAAGTDVTLLGNDG